MAYVTVFPVVGNGQKTIASAGTAEQLSASQPCKSITVKALSTNTGLVYVGDSSVDSSNGFILSANESISVDITDLNLIYLDVSVNGEGVSYFFVNVR